VFLVVLFGADNEDKGKTQSVGDGDVVLEKYVVDTIDGKSD